MKKFFFCAVVIVYVFMVGISSYSLSFCPPASEGHIDFLDPVKAEYQLLDSIEAGKKQIDLNIKRRSENSVIYYNENPVFDYFIFRKDCYITSTNDKIIYDIATKYALLITIESKNLKDKNTASQKLKEFENFVSNNCIIQHYTYYKRLIANLEKNLESYNQSEL